MRVESNGSGAAVSEPVITVPSCATIDTGARPHGGGESGGDNRDDTGGSSSDLVRSVVNPPLLLTE